jgi:hypothetical protein
MTLIVNLPEQLEGRLKRAAQAQGLAEDEFVIRTLEQRLTNDRQEGVLELLRHWREEDATADADEIAERKRSWEAFKTGMNEHHSSGRQVFP